MKSIRWRLVGFYVLLVTIVMILSGTIIVTMLRNDAYSKLEDELKESVRNVKHDIELNTNIDEIRTALIKNVAGLGSISKDKQIYLLNDEGYEIYPYEREEKYTSHVVRAAMEGMFSNEFGRSYAQEGGETVEYREYAEPVVIDDEVTFVIYAKMSTRSVEQNLNDTIFIILVAILFALVFATLLGAVLATTLTKPITALTIKAREMAEGHLDNTIEVRSDDEIGQLTQNFNVMARALSKTLSEMISEKSKLETVFSHMTDGILVFDRYGVLTHINHTATKIFEGMKQDSYDDLFRPIMDIKYEEIFSIVHQDIVQHIIKMEEKYYNICFAPYQSQNDAYIGVICVIQDITKHKKLEEMQKEFVANVSHELRTPLTTIKSYTETLLDGALEDREITEKFLEVINHESDRMTNLVQDLLDLSRLDNRQTQFTMQHMNLTYVLEDSIHKYRIHADKKGQKMNYDVPDKAYKMYGDPNRIEQVIKNIISNAVKYSPEGASIDVRMEEEDQELIIAIKDSGIGIPKEDIPRIFDRFYRVDKARSRAMGGTGLGLAIAKEIMEYHGGQITVESELGKGTCFYLRFPKEQRK